MTKTLAITPSFAAWRRAADRLLALEKALALSQRTAAPGAVRPGTADTAEIEEARLLASELFEIAFAEAHQERTHAPAHHGAAA